MTEHSDEVVWQWVLDGSAHEYAIFWRRHRDHVFHHHVRSGTSSSDAEDLTALTFLELWRRRAYVRFVDGSLLPWLLVTARNVARNSARARRRHQRFLAALPPPDVAPDPADGVVEHADEKWSSLSKELKRSRPSDRHLLVMTAVEGFTVREAAAALGLSESAAKMRLKRLRARVRGAVATNQLRVEGESS